MAVLCTPVAVIVAGPLIVAVHVHGNATVGVIENEIRTWVRLASTARPPQADAPRYQRRPRPPPL